VRLFVAVFPPDEVSWDLRRRLIAAGKRGVRLTPIDRWHVTLAFLGEVEPARLAAVEQALGLVAVPKGTELRLRGGGRFGNGRSTVLWAGVAGALGKLRADVCDRLGMPDREFTPHLTVAYQDDPGVRLALDSYVGPSWSLNEIALVRSDPGEGYTTLRSW
jgi:RNA 2',3'-cyclic 3'-phosphodiesterase